MRLRTKAGPISYCRVVKGIEPRDQIETMLAAQMAAVHAASMTMARRLATAENIEQQDCAERAFNKLTRTFAVQVEALKNYRSKGEQKMTVQHVHVAEGGQAIVGNVSTPALGAGRAKKRRNNPMLLAYAPGVEMPRQDRSGAGSSAKRRPFADLEVCRMHGAAGGAPKGNRNALKHGAFGAEAMAVREDIRALIRMTRKTLAAID